MSLSPIDRLSAVPAVLNRSPEILRKGRHFTADMGIMIDDAMTIFHILNGQITAVTPPPMVMPSYDFSISAAAPTWIQFWQPAPPPRRHDIMGLLRAGDMHFTGNLQPMMAHLFYVKAVLELPRQIGTEQ